VTPFRIHHLEHRPDFSDQETELVHDSLNRLRIEAQRVSQPQARLPEWRKSVFSGNPIGLSGWSRMVTAASQGGHELRLGASISAPEFSGPALHHPDVALLPLLQRTFWPRHDSNQPAAIAKIRCATVFLWLHPLLDGNGRLARAILASALAFPTNDNAGRLVNFVDTLWPLARGQYFRRILNGEEASLSMLSALREALY
jgi:hypothetical protein